MSKGPCIICGAVNSPLSMGGPMICPACDCGPPNPRKVREERERLLSQVRADAFRAGAAAMREQAAKVCEWRGRSLSDGRQYGAALEAEKCAMAIRSGPTPLPSPAEEDGNPTAGPHQTR